MANIFGTSGNNTNLTGTSSADNIYGYAGNDVLKGLAGTDKLYGGIGNDTLEGGTGADRLDGGSGIDTASYATATSGVAIHLWDNDAAGAAAGDTFFSIENLTGSNHADTIVGNAGNNIIKGLEGNDYLNGGAGNDTLKGGVANDKFGYNLTATDDYLPFSPGGGKDVVTDFVRGQDKLAVSVNGDAPEYDFLSVEGQQVFELLDSNNDNKLTGADKWVDVKSVTVNGVAKASLVMDIGAGVGEQMFGGAGEDTLAVYDMTTLYKSDFGLA
jgi:Ca2+-binding RTX toxin-like protein